MFNTRLIQGAGIGLRSCHYDYILKNLPNIPWFEALSDNYLNDADGLQFLEAIREHYPIVLHGVGMSLGSTDPLDFDYLKRLKTLFQHIQSSFISDHLSWVSADKKYLHDLIPLPLTEEAINHVSDRIDQVQTFLGEAILIENPSSYFEYESSEMNEWDFINAITEKTGCYMLLDVNNVYVSAFNNDFDANTYIKNINPKRVKQIHLAGYSDEKDYLFDMHNQTIHEPVWQLYQATLEQCGPVPTLIERDDNIPPFAELAAEARKAQQFIDSICPEKINAI